MPAGIAKVDGKAAFFSAKVPAWHSLGTVTEDVLTAQEALEIAHLDWDVSLKRKQWLDDDGNPTLIENSYAVIRDTDSHVLGEVSGDYKIFQNSEVFSFFDSVVDSGDAKYETAGALHDGKRIFLTAKIGDTISVAGQDDHDLYLMFTTSHDGTQAFQACTTMVRVVCQNTVSMALRGAKTRWSLRHKSTLDGKVQEARDSLGLAFKYQDAFEKAVEEMMQIQVEKDEFLKIVAGVVPDQKRKKERTLEELSDIFEYEPTVIDAAGAGTAWGAYNAFTFWTDWAKESRSDQAKFKAVTEATIASDRTKVYNGLLALV